MTHSSTLHAAAPSSLGSLRPSTLVLAAVIALEMLGLRALPAAQGRVSVAAADGATVYAQTGSVEVRIVAQADIAAH